MSYAQLEEAVARWGVQKFQHFKGDVIIRMKSKCEMSQFEFGSSSRRSPQAPMGPLPACGNGVAMDVAGATDAGTAKAAMEKFAKDSGLRGPTVSMMSVRGVRAGRSW